MTFSWSVFLRRIGIDVRAHEAAIVLLLFGYSFLLGVFQFSSKAVRQATYVDSLGSEQLPWVYLAVALVAYPALRIYRLVGERWSHRRVIVGTTLGVAFGQTLFWALLGATNRWAPFLYYLWISIAIALTFTQFWSYVNTVLDARQARRLFGLIGAGSLLGGVLGGQVARWAGASEPRSALLAGALVMVAIAALAAWSSREDHSTIAVANLAKRASSSGYEALRGSAHLRLIAILLLLTVVVSQIIDLQFNWAVEQSTRDLAERTARFGNLFSIMGLGAFFFQLLVTTRVHQFLGVGFAMRVLPLFVMVFSVLVGFSDLFFPVAVFSLVWSLKIGDNGLRYSLDHATRELLFVPVRAEERVQAKSFIDVFVHRLAKGIGALLLFSVTFGWISVMQTTWVALALCLVWLVCTFVAQRQYVDSLRTGLAPDKRSGGAGDEAALIDVSDVTTLEVLVESLGSTDAARVVTSIELLTTNGRAHLVTPLLLHHESPEVRVQTLAALTAADRADALPSIEKRIGDPEQDVRAAAISAVAALSGTEGRRLMEPRLRDADPRVRAAAITYLSVQPDIDAVKSAEQALLDLLSEETAEARVEAAKALSEIPEPVFRQHLIGLLFDADPSVVRFAIVAVRQRLVPEDQKSPLYVPILVSLLRERRLKHDAREALVSYGETVLPALAHFMNDDNEFIWVRRALPKTIASIRTEAATETLYDSLQSSSDHFLRGKIVEALSRCDLRPRQDRIERLVVEECRRCSALLVSLVGVSQPKDFWLHGPALEWNAKPRLLQRLLDERRHGCLENIRTLLALGGRKHAVDRAWQRLLGTNAQQRGQALEYLDNILTRENRRVVMAVIDDLPVPERLRQFERLFGLQRGTYEETLVGLIESAQDDDEGAPWLAAAAIQMLSERAPASLRARLEHWTSESQHELVRETAQWASNLS